MRLSGKILLFLGCAGSLFASIPTVPEIDGSTAASALALVAGSIMILRGRLRK